VTARTLEPFDPDVVAPWRIGEGRRGVLLLHGFAGTPPELRRLGEHLAARGFRCQAPALPGHAATPDALERTTWQEWATGALHAFNELATECDEVFVAGQSMGGTLALHIAANDLRAVAVASLATPLWLNGHLQHLLPVIKHFVRWHRPGDDVDLWNQDAIEELYSYGLRSTRSIHELKRLTAAVRDELPQVRAPVLVLHGARDRSVDPRNATEIVSRLICSAAVEQHTFARSGHALSVDIDREAVNELVYAWFERWSPSSRAAVAGSSTGLAGGPSSKSPRRRSRAVRTGSGAAPGRPRVTNPHPTQR
jgi:carboxylesterase